MKSNLNIPALKYSMPSKIPPSFILYNMYDKYFGAHYILFENGYNCLMTKDIKQCYRIHADYINNCNNKSTLKEIQYV